MKVVSTGRSAGRIHRLTGRLLLRFVTVFVTVLLVSAASVGSVSAADDKDFSNDTMETRVTSPPPNIMFVLDNSGSMDWSFMAPEGNGHFNGSSYLWSMGDNVYSPTASNGRISNTLEWQGQWSGYNRIFYNPHSSYVPWPRWNEAANTEGTDGILIKSGGTYPAFNADLKEPRSNPVDRGNTLNLHDNYVDIATLNASAVIVDDADGSPMFTETGFSGPSSTYNPHWNSGYHYSTSRSTATATFTPELTAGRYTVWAYWPCATDRDVNVKISLNINGTEYKERRTQRATSDNNPRLGYCGSWIPLFKKQLYTMPQGTLTSLSIIRDNQSRGTTQADAVAFLPEGKTEVAETVHVKNAHYYTVDDKNGDGSPQEGEVYLVNFEWTDSNSDGNVEDGEVLRRYYLVSYDNDGDNHQDVTSLQEVQYDPAAEYDANADGVPDNADEVPDSIQPVIYDDDLKKDVFVSDLDDLQNFANWFSFYRRRELTAKAAVSRTIAELDNVYVGYNTMHREVYGGGAKQEVLPINVYESVHTETIVDNNDSGFSRSNNWSESNSRPEWKDSSLFTGRNGEWAKFTPTLSEAGQYEVSAWWNCYTDRDQKARITVEHKLGTTVEYYNQRASSSNAVTLGDCTDSRGSGCCGDWVNLGKYYFDAGQNGFVEIKHTSASTSSTVADAVRFRLEGVINTAKVDQSEKLLDVLYQIYSSGGTPLRQTLQEVGKYYDKDDNSDGGIGDCPYLSVEQGGACQQAYAIAMTDGFWNGGSPNVGNQDGGKGSPYEDSYSNTLADVAMRYYDTDLAGDLLDEMSTNNYDKKKTQHMVTFGVSFGLNGTIDPTDIDGDGVTDNPGYADDPYFLDFDTPHPTWPEIRADQASTIDDLWHASVNGRGKYFSAKDPDTLVAALRETFADIGSRKASGASVSVNGDELSTGLVLYQSSYESGVWQGNVTAYPIDPHTGEIKRKDNEILWHVRDILEGQDWDDERNIFTFDGTQGVPFRYNQLSQAQQDALSLDNKDGAKSVEFLRGGPAPGNGFRERETVLGDLVHSAPLLVSAVDPEKDGIDNDNDGLIDEGEIMDYARLSDGIDNDGDGLTDEGDEKHDGIDNDGDGQVDEEEPQETGGTLFVGGNDGMLHAFNAETGAERFAYVPLRSFDYLFDLTKADYEHRYYVDGRQHFQRLKFFAGDQSKDQKDNDGDGQVDEPDENYSDYVNNDHDKDEHGVELIDEPFEYKTITLLVGTLNKGGRGIYALDISEAESIVAASDEAVTAGKMAMWEYPPVGTDGMAYTSVGKGADADNSDGFDNDGDGTVDEEDEMALVNILLPAENDSIDNDNDGVIDEAGEVKQENELDPDMGYTFGDAFIARSYITKNEMYDKNDHPWVVIFSNGYQSKNGQAVLYILDALTGNLLRKIAAGPSGNNGLSSPTIIDIDNDDRVDFVYAGDLQGNMWKFDLRDPDPQNWGVMYGTDSVNPAEMDKNNKRVARIDYNDADSSGKRDEPQPLINVGRPITTAPDVAYHCEENGYIVIFGTGKFLGANDVKDNSRQGIFGIWDFGDNPKDYLGIWQASDNSFPAPGHSELKNVQLLEQVEIDWRKYHNSFLRTLSDNKPQWSASDLCYNNIDDDGDGVKDNESCIPSSGHAGWFFDLPYHLGLDEMDNDGDGQIDEADEADILAGERVVKDVLIRDGNAVVISLIPGDSPCDGGGNSMVHEIPYCSGGRLDESAFDIDEDRKITTPDDYIEIEVDDPDNPGQKKTIKVPVNGKMYDGILHKPVIVGDPDEEKDRELKIFSSSAGTTEVMWERKEDIGFYYWKEH